MFLTRRSLEIRQWYFISYSDMILMEPTQPQWMVNKCFCRKKKRNWRNWNFLLHLAPKHPANIKWAILFWNHLLRAVNSITINQCQFHKSCECHKRHMALKPLRKLFKSPFCAGERSCVLVKLLSDHSHSNSLLGGWSCSYINIHFNVL